jgi:hypothetical protein
MPLGTSSARNTTRSPYSIVTVPRVNVVEATKNMSWANYAKAVLKG